MPWLSDKCIHFKGTAGAGGTAKLQGSNDGATVPVFGGITLALLRSPDSVVISATGESLFQILESPVWIRPLVTAGDGTTNFTALLMCKPNTRQY